MMDAKIQAAVDAAVEQGTFSLQAVEGIKQLRAERESLASGLEAKAKELSRKIEENSKLSSDLAAVSGELTKAREREAAVATREATVHRAEIKQAADAARAETVFQCFGMVFRNTVLRETLNKAIPIAGGNGGAGYISQATETSTRETE